MMGYKIILYINWRTQLILYILYYYTILYCNTIETLSSYYRFPSQAFFSYTDRYWLLPSLCPNNVTDSAGGETAHWASRCISVEGQAVWSIYIRERFQSPAVYKYQPLSHLDQEQNGGHLSRLCGLCEPLSANNIIRRYYCLSETYRWDRTLLR